MTSSRPYLVRALYDWIVDNGHTPYLLVDARKEGVSAPTDLADPSGRLVLNVSPRAVRQLDLGLADITFEARFSGTAWLVSLPVSAVMAIYAKENGYGMMFSDDDHTQPPDGKRDDVQGMEDAPASPRRPILRVVK